MKEYPFLCHSVTGKRLITKRRWQGS
uniref:Uncharacterized protein n=1 Tax=Arundo donax TaxID=35708 RepID=A0A0A9F1W5_ARUDO